jgi:hypothetical protein
VPAIDPAQAGISIAWSCYFAKTTPLVFIGVSHPRLSDGRSESLAEYIPAISISQVLLLKIKFEKFRPGGIFSYQGSSIL